jgi:glycosyltransferase involved in cell wall biosynthesis
VATRRVLLISHCDFTGSSALHVYKIASELFVRGHHPVVAVPDDPETVEDVGRPPFPVVGFEDVLREGLQFPDGGQLDLVHAFTPRERVRTLTMEVIRRFRLPYVVHLEDNEWAILSAQLDGLTAEELFQLPLSVLDRLIGPSQFHPRRGIHFLRHAAGVTAVIQSLLGLFPLRVPAAVITPGFDEDMVSAPQERESARATLGLTQDEFVLAYTGNVHAANAAEIQSLYDAVSELRGQNQRVTLLKTGWNAPESGRLVKRSEGVVDLGWVPRSTLPTVVAAADAFVQPGESDAFNDYRLPSKLPDYLASGKPVIVPPANLGLALRDRKEALILKNGSATELCEAIALLRRDPGLARTIGAAGREFAYRELRWSSNVGRLEDLYGALATVDQRPTLASRSEFEPLVRIVALVAEPPDVAIARTARAHGVYGFCFPADFSLLDKDIGFPYCFRVNDPGLLGAATELALRHLVKPDYLAIAEAPLLVADDAEIARAWRTRVEAALGERVHISLMKSASGEEKEPREFDSVIEPPAMPLTQKSADPTMIEHLERQLPSYVWFRSVAASDDLTSTTYGTWLRKLVLQTLCRSPRQYALVFVDAQRIGGHPHGHARWLGETRAAFRSAVGQYYAASQLKIPTRALDREITFASPDTDNRSTP